MTSTQITKTQNTDLDVKRITAINAYHCALEDALGKGLDYAIKAGELLAEQKAKIKHGEWTGWLEANFVGSARTAQEYMRIAANREQIAQASSMREAIAELSPPRRKNATAADLPDDPSEPTRLQTELRTAAVGAWLQAGRRLVKRLDSAVQKAFSEEADADGRIDLPAEFWEWVAAKPGQVPA